MSAGYAYYIADCQLKAEIESQVMIQVNDPAYVSAWLSHVCRWLADAVRSW